MIIVHQIYARRCIQTLSLAIVEIALAISSRPSFPAVTRIISMTVLTLQCIQATIFQALVHI